MLHSDHTARVTNAGAESVWTSVRIAAQFIATISSAIGRPAVVCNTSFVCLTNRSASLYE